MNLGLTNLRKKSGRKEGRRYKCERDTCKDEKGSEIKK